MKTFVIKNTWWPRTEQLDFGWGNGYVVIPETHPLHGMDYHAIHECLPQLKVNGGVTFSESADSLNWPELPEGSERGWVIGFDTSHGWDTLEKWPKQRVIEEAENLKKQLLEMMDITFQDELINMRACDEEAIEWASGKTTKEAFDTCKRGDWMLWYIFTKKNELGLSDMKLITKAKVLIARQAQHLMKDERSLNALDVAEKFSEGKATLDELKEAASVAYAAYAASVCASAYSVAYAYAAAAAYAAASVEDVASATAYAAASAATSAVPASSKEAYLKEYADICREVFKDIRKKL